MQNKRKKVIVAMSGGVDSSVAALLCLRAGYEVVGAFMVNWSETKNAAGECAWREERRDAERVAARLGIPLLTYDLEEQYQREVVDYMDREYAAGRTPNPDVMCNEKIKFAAFYERALADGADFIATGHYARVSPEGDLLHAADETKDQVYFLYRVPRAVLQRVLFPLGDLRKTEVRALAAEAGLPTAAKKDSQGLCFVGKVNMRKFLQTRLSMQPGPVVDEQGALIGTHEGVAFYTLGQRHGLHLGIAHETYIARRDVETNTLTVVQDKHHPLLSHKTVRFTDCVWRREPLDGQRVVAQIRYRGEKVWATLRREAGDWVAHFDTPVWAPASGQSLLCSAGEEVIGGGIIV